MAGSNFWAQGLVKTLSDKANHIISSDCAVVIKDMYPKAQHHYLVLPKENIPTIFDVSLNNSFSTVLLSDVLPSIKDILVFYNKFLITSQLTLAHLPLLDELHLLALNIIEVKQLQRTDFKIGFHAEPSMQRVHLHVISQDFVSDCLKKKQHWNSFNSHYFRPFEDVYEELKTNGAVKRFDKEKLKRFLNLDLLCNQCHFAAKNIPKLKEHLLEHWNEKCNK